MVLLLEVVFDLRYHSVAKRTFSLESLYEH